MTYIDNQKRGRKQTKQEGIKASIGQVLIDKKLFIFLQAASQKPDKIFVLKFCNDLHFILKLFNALPW